MAGNILAMCRSRRWCSSDRRAPARLKEPGARIQEPGGPTAGRKVEFSAAFYSICRQCVDVVNLLAPGSFRRAGVRTRAMLPNSITPLIEALKTVPGIRAIVVGGAPPPGHDHPASTTNISFTYHPATPLAVEALDRV